jgi:FkbM family methyltransferase
MWRLSDNSRKECLCCNLWTEQTYRMTIIKRLTSAISARRHESSSDEPGELTREHVIWGYRLFLDREPENDLVIEEKVTSNRDTKQLRNNFMLSPEFGENNPDLTLFNDRNIVIKELDGNLRLFVDTSDVVIGWGIIRGKYETSELDFVRRTIGPGQTVLDIGANIGLFTVTMASLIGPTGKVYAFEPLDDLAALLARSVAENNFGDRVLLERAAVSDKPGSGHIISALKTTNAGGAYLNEGQVPLGHEASEVKLITLDTYPVRRPVHFIKIDVEGAELLAFRGAKELLQKDRPVILSELHPAQLLKVSGCTAAEFVAELESYNYKCHELRGAQLAPFTAEAERVKSVVFLPV